MLWGHDNRFRSVHASSGSTVNQRAWARAGISDEVNLTFISGQTMVALLRSSREYSERSSRPTIRRKDCQKSWHSTSSGVRCSHIRRNARVIESPGHLSVGLHKSSGSSGGRDVDRLVIIYLAKSNSLASCGMTWSLRRTKISK